MADKSLKLMGVHGLGDHRASDWKTTWPDAIVKAFPKIEGLSLQFDFMSYDDIYEATDLTFAECAIAVWKLGKSGVFSVGRRDRGVLSETSERIKWTAGYVVAWVEDEDFQAKARQRVYETLEKQRPDVVLAHSLGSLVTYNAFTHPDARKAGIGKLLKNLTYVTLGSQIANPFVIRNLTNGRVQPLDVKFWHHLYNVHDDVFTAPIRVWDAPNFAQTETPFDIEGMADHSAESYFTNRATTVNVWQKIGEAAIGVQPLGRALTAPPSKAGKTAKALSAPATPGRRRQKALLVGINDYPDPAQRLEGCVNDVFTMSAVLQQCGFPPESIRTCLDSRATADGILSRIKWLLDDPQPGDELIFYYSGHGTRIPEYGENYEPDHYLETLVPWDFDWKPETYISDDQIYGLYSQLPFDCRFVMIFDCCNAGGMSRSGAAKPKGISPPDDIRHRELKWDVKTGMWVSRDFERINPDFTSQPEVAVDFFGKKGATQRIGRAAMLRGLSEKQYEAMKKTDKAMAPGPYLPVIIEACGEEERSYEYRHGATSHGAFTFSLANILGREKKITFEQLIRQTRDQLADLQYDQTPRILGPGFLLNQRIPWIA